VPTRRSYKGQSPDERDAARRERLLEAALALYGTHGWNGTSVVGLCREAGVTTRHFYALFDDREELFLALYDRIVGDVLQAGAAAVATVPMGDWPAMARAGLRATARAYHEDPRRARVALIEVHGISARAEAHRRTAIAQAADFLAGVSAQLVASGAMPPRVPRVTALALVGAAVELLVHRAMTGEPGEDVLVEELTRLFVLAFGGAPG